MASSSLSSASAVRKQDTFEMAEKTSPKDASALVAIASDEIEDESDMVFAETKSTRQDLINMQRLGRKQQFIVGSSCRHYSPP